MLTSVTPGTRASCGRTTQSMTVCKSVGVVERAVGAVRAGCDAQDEHEDLAQARRDRAELGLEARRQLGARLLQPLARRAGARSRCPCRPRTRP